MDKIFNRILDLLFPRPYLERQIASLSLPDLLSRGRAQSLPDPNIHALFSYKDPVIRRMIWMLKYRGSTRIALLFADALRDNILSILEENFDSMRIKEIIIVPIPSSYTYDRKHPRAQTELLADGLAKESSLFKREKLLRKVRRTKRQTETKNKKERLENLKDAFAIAKAPSTRGDTLYVIIDDVTTTGATLGEARKVLQNAGAKNVIGVAVAH